jgi:hypothetical protein
MAENNGWNEYSRLVLKELETLAVGISNLSSEIQDVKREIALIKDREDKVEKLVEWKERVTNVVSASQLEVMVKEVNDLKEFKTKAITAFIVIQALMAMAMTVLNYLK